MTTPFEAVGGRDTLLRLAAAWHHHVLNDELVAHAFHGGAKPDHTERLAAYWVEALGGPPDYSSVYGDETQVERMHAGNGEHEEMNRRAVDCFDAAMADAGVHDDRLRALLHDYFEWATWNPMYRYHRSPDDVPAALAVPTWSWSGPVGPA